MTGRSGLAGDRRLVVLQPDDTERLDPVLPVRRRPGGHRYPLRRPLASGRVVTGTLESSACRQVRVYDDFSPVWTLIEGGV
ncbi:hypothetical protein [Streptomyces yangpuensis]|uniref:hypothetical protein n=1 Tax=Streptomyces yangpuensis TaxID=1648182 RepID=UPI0036489200